MELYAIIRHLKRNGYIQNTALYIGDKNYIKEQLISIAGTKEKSQWNKIGFGAYYEDPYDNSKSYSINYFGKYNNPCEIQIT